MIFDNKSTSSIISFLIENFFKFCGGAHSCVCLQVGGWIDLTFTTHTIILYLFWLWNWVSSWYKVLSCGLFCVGNQSGAMDASNMLKPMLGRGELRCIGATTLNEYRNYIEKDPALERRFQQVFCDQPSVENTISILRGLRERYELHHGVKISDSALVSAAVLADRYITERFLPDKGKWHILFTLHADI